MCGITGFWQREPVETEPARQLVRRMAARIAHRGPDDAGAWVDDAAGLVLGHRRLSIIDLSTEGHQPMPSASGRFVIAYNGEIYNHLDLRRRLEQGGRVAAAWRGHSDTETLLAAIDAWGVRESLERCNGMFAFALWDRQTRALTLARDRLGEKPLYYGWQGQGSGRTFLFGSELKAMKVHPAFEGAIDRGALTQLLRHNCVPSPYSIYHGIAKLPPGHLLEISRDRPEPRPIPYWSAVRVAQAGVAGRVQKSPTEWVDELEQLLKVAIRRQTIADVPLGAFLSGGVDSSTIVALMQSISSKPVRTFTIGFHEAGFSEAEHAKAVAQHLGTDHTDLYITAEQAMAVIPRLPTLYDEPFADSSQIPTFLVSQLARRDVTVSLSGDAGDELFAGYNRYVLTSRLWGHLERLPHPVRRALAAAIRALSPSTLDTLGRALPKTLKLATLGEKLHKAAALLNVRSTDELYHGMVSHWPDPASVVIDAQEPPTQLTGLRPALDGLNAIERMMVLDTLTYLADDILAKIDRAAMGVSLETRVPFLDADVVELAWRMPMDCKLRDGQSKWALRQVLYRHVPQALIDRPKMGFGVPIDQWLRGPLREWAETLLDESRLRREGFFQPVPIRRKWAEHLSGQRNWQYHLWDVLMFQAWLADQSASPP